MSEYPEVYIDDLGVHCMLPFNRIDEIINEYLKHHTINRNNDLYIHEQDILKQIVGLSNGIMSRLPHLRSNNIDYEDGICLKNFLIDRIRRAINEFNKTDTFDESHFVNNRSRERLQCPIFKGIYFPLNEQNKYLQTISTLQNKIRNLESANNVLTHENEILTQKQTVLDREAQHDENVLSLIHEQVINVLKSYGGNWVMNAFNSQRQEEVLNYLYHRYKNISTNDLKKAFDSILDELSNINLKPFGE